MAMRGYARSVFREMMVNPHEARIEPPSRSTLEQTVRPVWTLGDEADRDEDEAVECEHNPTTVVSALSLRRPLRERETARD
jgi:hypothetical protein